MLRKMTIQCDWPSCTATVELVYRGESGFDWNAKSWRAIGSETHGPHLCQVHSLRGEESLKRVRERAKDAEALAQEITALAVGDTSLLPGAAMAFKAIFPGCEASWKKAVGHGR